MATHDERWRCFVAVPISDELRMSLAPYVTELRQSPWADDWRWADPEGWHITLAFLGSISASTVPSISQALDEVAARHSAFTANTAGLGAFPSMRRPRVLWYGIDDPDGLLAALAADVCSVLHVDEDAPFRGHITLGRRRMSGISPQATQLAPLCGAFDALRIDRMCLCRSVRGSYRCLLETRLIR